MSIKFFVKNIVITIFPALCYSQVIDLDSLYVSCPSDSEYQGIIDDFNIVLEDGDEEYAKWSLYDPYLFDSNSTAPSIFPLINKLRVIREQIFSKPLPFADNDLYEYMLSHYRNGGIQLSLRTGNNLAGGEWMYLNAGNTFWDVRTSSDPFTPFPNFSVWPYIHGTQLFVHETRHCDVDDPHHDLQQSNKDTQFSAEGGYGRACIYYMWVYKYGVNNSYTIRNSAAGEAACFLMTRFVEMPPTHPNPDIQELIDELLAKLEIASGYDQTGIVGSTLANPLEVTVEVSAANFSYAWGNGVPVNFCISSTPEGSVGHSVSVTSDTTDIMGKASTILTLGDKAGTYVVSTTAPMLGDTIIFSANAVFPLTFINNLDRTIPQSFCLNQNYPNPFNPETTISFELPNISEVKIIIFNLNSQLVAEIYSGRKTAGYHSVTWDASNNSAGIYLIKFTAGDFIQTRKCILLK